MGNHDFGHNDYFEKELSIPVHNGDIKRTLLGKRFYISHGDGKAANDTGYLILRSILRNSFLQSAFRVIHPDIGIRFAEWISGRSRSYTDGRDALQKSDGLRDFAEKLIGLGETDFVVMGHRHKSEIVKFEKGTYINLGDWIGSYTYGVFDEEGFRIEKAP
jgi:UDP-2,3-diacylglucosamine hydrolase